MTLEEKHDLVMQVIDSALKKGMWISFSFKIGIFTINDLGGNSELFFVNRDDEREKAMKYVSNYEPKKVLKHKFALLLTSESQLEAIQKHLESKEIDYNHLKDFKTNPVIFFDIDPNDSKKIWMDMADNMELEYLIEQGWDFLGTFSQGKQKFLDAVS